MITGLLAAALLANAAQAADCLRPDDHTALDITALKTQLMVTALTCQQDERYNAFVRKYQADLQREDRSLNGFFNRAYGRAGSKQRDDYVTQLANMESKTGLAQGTLFCARNIGVFDEVMSLRSSAELGDFAAAKGVAHPISATACGKGATPVSTTRKAAAARHRT